MKKKSILVEKSQKKVGEAQEVLDAIGHENEKEGIKWTQFFMSKWDKRQSEENQIKQEHLKKKAKFDKQRYYQAVAGMLAEEAVQMEIPLGYKVGAFFSKEGVVLKMRDRWGKDYHRAFKPNGTPSIDFVVVTNLLVELQNTIDYLEYNASQALPQDNGIILT